VSSYVSSHLDIEGPTRTGHMGSHGEIGDKLSSGSTEREESGGVTATLLTTNGADQAGKEKSLDTQPVGTRDSNG